MRRHTPITTGLLACRLFSGCAMGPDTPGSSRGTLSDAVSEEASPSGYALAGEELAGLVRGVLSLSSDVLDLQTEGHGEIQSSTIAYRHTLERSEIAQNGMSWTCAELGEGA